MKVFLDRCNPLFEQMKNKDFYYMVTAMDTERPNLEIVMDTFHGFAMCFDDIREKGRVYGGGADKKGDITSLPAYEEAYEMGKQI